MTKGVLETGSLKEPSTDRLRRFFKKHIIFMRLVLVGCSIALSTGLAELALRVTWENPNVPKIIGVDYADYIRLQIANRNNSWDARGLYAGADIIRFRTDGDGAIIGLQRPGLPVAHFYGGSTTETGAVNEGSRWPELIETVSARNFGLAHNNMINNYSNFRFHLDTMPAPSEAFFMEAANDLVFSEEEYLNTRPPKKPHRWFRVYLYDFLRVAYQNIQGGRLRPVDYFRKNPVLERQKNQPKLSDEEFQEYVNKILIPSLERREHLIDEIITLGRRYSVKVTFLTQPNSYRQDFFPFEGVDLRTYPQLGNKLFSLSQCARILKMANESTRLVALRNGAAVIDVASAFEAQVPDALFYDNFHYTEIGSRFFAKVVNAERAR